MRTLAYNSDQEDEIVAWLATQRGEMLRRQVERARASLTTANRVHGPDSVVALQWDRTVQRLGVAISQQAVDAGRNAHATC